MSDFIFHLIMSICNYFWIDEIDKLVILFNDLYFCKKQWVLIQVGILYYYSVGIVVHNVVYR